jgi:hypothetical protein
MILRSPARLRIHDRDWLERTGGWLLLAAGCIVGVAIAGDGALARGINGVAGITWIVAAAILVASRRGDAEFWLRLPAVVGIGVVLVLLIKPSNLAWAIIGFGAAGAAIAFVFNRDGLIWAKILPALWLPEHLGVAVAKAIVREIRDQPANVRTDPPPTAVLVPLAMIVAAWGAAMLVERYRNRRVKPA